MDGTVEIIFLGTGTPAAMPVGACPCRYCVSYRTAGKVQYRPAVLIKSHKGTLLLDVGPDIRNQAIAHSIDNIDGVFVTHAHGDHFGGLPDLALLKYSGLSLPSIYVNRGVREHAKRYFDWVDVEFIVTEPKTTYAVADFRVTVLRGDHGGAFEFSIIVVDHDDGRVVYMPDTKAPPDAASWSYIVHPHVAVTDGSYAFGPLIDPLNVVTPADLLDSTHPSREELHRMWEGLEAKSVYLTHVSEHFTQLSMRDMEAKLPENVHVAVDGLRVHVA